jgi:hypothetical protein
MDDRVDPGELSLALPFCGSEFPFLVVICVVTSASTQPVWFPELFSNVDECYRGVDM